MNIIPVIAKADTISKSELHKFKIKIMSELVSNGVQIYQFPLDDETVAKVNTTMNVSETHAHAHEYERAEGHASKLDLVLIEWDIGEVFFAGCQWGSCALVQGHLPFAVVGSTEEVSVGNKMVKARQYPWGVVQGKVSVCVCVYVCGSSRRKGMGFIRCHQCTASALL